MKTPHTTILKGRTKEVSITPFQRSVIIGERCNALGYKSVRESVERKDFSVVLERAKSQVTAGADILNVNMVGMSLKEEWALPEAVERIAAELDVPLSIDFGSTAALEAALKVAPGKSLINSVNGEASKLNPTLELAARYKAAVIVLPCDESGIPQTPKERLKCALKIRERAESFGIPPEDLIYDAICIAISTEPAAGPAAFETCRLFRSELGASVTLGASNVSFGLPKRRTLDSFYLAMAIQAGMNVPITDPTLPVLKWAVLSADACLGNDEFGMQYIRTFRAEEKTRIAAEALAHT